MGVEALGLGEGMMLVRLVLGTAALLAVPPASAQAPLAPAVGSADQAGNQIRLNRPPGGGDEPARPAESGPAILADITPEESLRLFESAGVRPRIVQRVNQAHTMLALVGAGLGVALVPESVRGIRMAGAALRPIRLPAAARSELLLAWRRDDDSPCLRSVRAAVVSQFHGAPDRGPGP